MIDDALGRRQSTQERSDIIQLIPSPRVQDDDGLGIFPGAIKRFNGSARIPHMGWNSLSSVKPCALTCGIPEGTYMYFAHSYYAPLITATAAACTYIQPYTAILHERNVYAVQFHPEKSGPAGLKIVKNFLDL